MKKSIIYLMLTLLYFSSFNGFSQFFQTTLNVQGRDMNHYSIESLEERQEYVCAGTIFNENDTDIHLFKTDLEGNILWEVFIDESTDDRGLDVTIDLAQDIILTGYITIDGSSKLFIAKYDMNGNLLGNTILSDFPVSVGTNVIFSERTEHYIVGGFVADNLELPLSDNYSILAEFDYDLNYVKHLEFRGDVSSNLDAINDIVETNNGYFVTGGVSTELGRFVQGVSRFGVQGVLAVSLDYDLSVIGDVSFESTNLRQNGVSLAYNENADRIFLMSNNSIQHNPVITMINNASVNPTIALEYALLIENAPAFNAAGFQLEFSGAGVLTAAGYFRSYDISGSGNTRPWIVSFKANGGGMIDGSVWTTDAPEFSFHGGNVLSTFVGEHPFLFTQEILTENVSRRGFVFLGPRTINDNYGLDIVSTVGPDCFEPWTFNSSFLSSFPVNVSIIQNEAVSSNFEQTLISQESIPFNICPSIRAQDIIDDNNQLENDNAIVKNNFDFQVYPNPSISAFNIELIGENNLSGQFVMKNTLGQIVYSLIVEDRGDHQFKVDIENLNEGIYFLSFKLNDSEIELTKKVIKI